MSGWKLSTLALVAAATLAVIVQERSIVPLPLAKITKELPPFERTHSAGLFVGVRQFQGDDSPTPVPYAVDDAVDLAWTFAFDETVQLVEPQKVVLALSGEPVKEVSKERLAQLLAAGAQRAEATQETVLKLLEQQAGRVGSGGMFLISFATHGFITDGEPYVLGATSSFNRESTLSALTVFDIAARASRSLILMDACRERIPDARSAGSRRLTADVLEKRRGLTAGQAILYAPPFAFDDHGSRNGIFTKAVLEGLACRARKSTGAVTVEGLSKYVNTRVKDWLRKNRPGISPSGIQTSVDGNVAPLPLAACPTCATGRPSGPALVVKAASSITAFTTKKKELWHRDLGAPVIAAEKADLDCDSNREVVAATRDRIVAFDKEGRELWSVEAPEPLRTMQTGALFVTHRRQIVAMSKSRLFVYDPDGKLNTEFEYAGELQGMAIDRPTAHHDWRIVLTATNGKVLLLKPGNRKTGKIEWAGEIAPKQNIRNLEIRDADNDSSRDIVLHTQSGRVVLDFDGTTIRSRGVQFVRLAQRRPA